MAERRKRKDATGEFESSLSSAVQQKIPRLDVTVPENWTEDSACGSCIPDQNSASCCSSNGATVLAKLSTDFVDLEENGVAEEFFVTSAGGTAESGERPYFARSEKTPSGEVLCVSDQPEFATRRNEHKPRVGSTAAKMPTEDEIDEFFSAAEKELQEQFIDKYNYDIVNDQPLEGRYEWVRVQP